MKGVATGMLEHASDPASEPASRLQSSATKC